MSQQVPHTRYSRLRVMHVLFWMTGFCLALTIYQNFTPSGLRPTFHVIAWSYNSLMAMAGGFVFLGVSVLARGEASTRWRLSQQPGHLLLITGAVLLLANLVALVVCRPLLGEVDAYWLQFENMEDGHLAAAYHQIVFGVISTISLFVLLLLWPAAAPSAWKLFIVIVLLTAVAMAVSYAVPLIQFYGGRYAGSQLSKPTYLICLSLVSVAFVMATLTDMVKKSQRDWLHWCGWAATMLVIVAQGLVFSSMSL